jgi:L-aspartate oxidase
VHGANRLASNSLLEGMVFAARAVDAIRAGKAGPDASGAMRGVPHTPGCAVTPGTFEAGIPVRDELQRVMTRDAGVLRDAESLDRAAFALDVMTPTSVGEANLLAVSTALVCAATARRESRGTHTRIDHPDRADEFLGRFVFAGEPEPVFVPLATGPAHARAAAQPSRS